MLGVSLLIFALLAMAPGDPVDLLISGNPNVSPEEIGRLKQLYGLSDPIVVRYGKWLGRAVGGDLGWSVNYKVPVSQLLRERLPNSLILMTAGLTLALIVAVPVGLYSATRQYSAADYAASLATFVGFSVPLFWFALVMIYVFAVKLKVLPAGGLPTSSETGWGQTAQYMRHLILPTAVIALHNMASLTRYTRSSMLEVLHQDYIRTARAKGLSQMRVINRHALRNAMIPLVTVLALNLPILFAGAPVTESVFAWPGIGQLLVQSVLIGDHAVAVSVLMMIAIVAVLFNLAADVAYGALDPRIRYE